MIKTCTFCNGNDVAIMRDGLSMSYVEDNDGSGLVIFSESHCINERFEIFYCPFCKRELPIMEKAREQNDY
jgi:hypothetical protein